MTSISQLTAFRHDLHRQPELSTAEAQTARTMADWFQSLAPDETVAGLGGHGLAVVFKGPAPGPTVMLRAELDAVPVADAGRHDHVSRNPDAGHQCGHDGHLTILAGVGARLAERRPARGRVVLLCQPAEETGAGAAAVLQDPRFAALAPDWAFALHNLPGWPRGQVILRPGPFFCASRGLIANLTGSDSHAGHPEQGRNPAAALAKAIDALLTLPADAALRSAFSLVTIVHLRLGQPAFGVSPGDGHLWATLRADADDPMDRLADTAVRVVADIAAREGLAHEIEWRDVFAATVNHEAACRHVQHAAADRGLELVVPEAPFRVSEDFGRFGHSSRAAIFGLGSGRHHAALHSSGYDFPDELIPLGIGLFDSIVSAICGRVDQGAALPS